VLRFWYRLYQDVRGFTRGRKETRTGISNLSSTSFSSSKLVSGGGDDATELVCTESIGKGVGDVATLEDILL
jgi:hypothetical protein